MIRTRVLFVAANPAGTVPLKLDEEAREIEAKLRAAEFRDSLELITKWAVRPDDLLQALNQHKPHVVHFSGHGSSTEEIILLDRAGNPKPVSKAAIVSLFRTLKDNIHVVVLNACFSVPQAKAIIKEIDFAIGMARAVGDDAAITFSASFYRAIGFGRSIKEAFEQGITALLLEGSNESSTPVLLAKRGILAQRSNASSRPAATETQGLFRSGSAGSPEIDFRFINNKISIRGAINFVRDDPTIPTILDWLERKLTSHNESLEFVFDLEMVISSASPFLVRLVRILALSECESVFVRWKYRAEDKLNKSLGLGMKELFDSNRRKSNFVFYCQLASDH
jgi:hypothetical protein